MLTGGVVDPGVLLLDCVYDVLEYLRESLES